MEGVAYPFRNTLVVHYSCHCLKDYNVHPQLNRAHLLTSSLD
jgi:hypothetical protein